MGSEKVSFERKPYLLTGLPRPKYRGALVGFLHRTRLWYIIAAAYLASALHRSAAAAVPLTSFEILLRIGAAVISSANILISDAYHNADLKAGCYTKEHELLWMRWDYFGISAVLAYNQFLWSANAGWQCCTRLAAGYSALCLAVVGLASPKLSGNRDGSTKLVKYITGTQFMPSLTYTVLMMSGAMAQIGGSIYALYATGLVLYLSKRPQSMVFGFHEIFHSLVVLGHLASFGFDLRDISSPMARVAIGAWVHRSSPMTFDGVPLVLAPWCLLFVILPNKRRLLKKLGV
jgi:predicted membrane channel-forming protein YqfA (hemolysin III family)